MIPESFQQVTKETIGRFFEKFSDFESAYRSGHTCITVDKAVKAHKSHRRVTTSQ